MDAKLNGFTVCSFRVVLIRNIAELGHFTQYVHKLHVMPPEIHKIKNNVTLGGNRVSMLTHTYPLPTQTPEEDKSGHLQLPG